MNNRRTAAGLSLSVTLILFLHSSSGAVAPMRVLPSQEEEKAHQEGTSKVGNGVKISPEILRRAVAAAKSASKNAYCPYSKFPVGAAVVTDDDTVLSGCNVENASYGLTICAERNSVFQAAAKGYRTIKLVVVYTPTKEATAPCGACRQVVNEFGPQASVLCVCDSADTIEENMGNLLKRAFGPKNLTK